MRKRLFLALAALFAMSAGFSQVRYQGHLSAGYAVGTLRTTDNCVNVETLHGVRVNPWFFGGLGAGINYRSASESFNSHYYGNVRGYLLDRALTPFASLDLGYGLWSGGGGLYTSPGLGVNWCVGEHYALAFTAGMQTQRVEDAGIRWTEKHVVFRVELTF